MKNTKFLPHDCGRHFNFGSWIFFLYGGVETTTMGPSGNSISFNGTELKEEKKWTTYLVCQSRKDKC